MATVDSSSSEEDFEEDSEEEEEKEIFYTSRQIRFSSETVQARATEDQILNYFSKNLKESKGKYEDLLKNFYTPTLVRGYPKGRGGMYDLNMKQSNDRWGLQDGFRELVSNFYDEVMERVPVTFQSLYPWKELGP